MNSESSNKDGDDQIGLPWWHPKRLLGSSESSPEPKSESGSKQEKRKSSSWWSVLSPTDFSQPEKPSQPAEPKKNPPAKAEPLPATNIENVSSKSKPSINELSQFPFPQPAPPSKPDRHTVESSSSLRPDTTINSKTNEVVGGFNIQFTELSSARPNEVFSAPKPNDVFSTPASFKPVSSVFEDKSAAEPGEIVIDLNGLLSCDSSLQPEPFDELCVSATGEVIQPDPSEKSDSGTYEAYEVGFEGRLKSSDEFQIPRGLDLD